MKIALLFLMLCVTTTIAGIFQVSVQKRSASLLHQYHHVAGGILVRWKIVLTVAHIFEKSQKAEDIEKEDYRIVADGNKAERGMIGRLLTDREVKQIEKIYIPKAYVPGVLCLNDIALILLSTEFDKSSNGGIDIIDLKRGEYLATQNIIVSVWARKALKGLQLEQFVSSFPKIKWCPGSAPVNSKTLCIYSQYVGIYDDGSGTAMVDEEGTLRGIGCWSNEDARKLIIGFEDLKKFAKPVNEFLDTIEARDDKGNDKTIINVDLSTVEVANAINTTPVINIEPPSDNPLAGNSNSERSSELLPPKMYIPGAGKGQWPPLDQKITED